jgi:hypothetical protein
MVKKASPAPMPGAGASQIRPAVAPERPVDHEGRGQGDDSDPAAITIVQGQNVSSFWRCCASNSTFAGGTLMHQF